MPSSHRKMLSSTWAGKQWHRCTPPAVVDTGQWGLGSSPWSPLSSLSPHWGQRELFVRYEQEHKKKPGQLIAYQLNWKGENFYRGNQVPAFVSTGKRFKTWIAAQKKKGTSVFYFVTEHRRTRPLRNELGRPAVFEKLTDKTLNNKFQLIRVEFL